MNKNTKEQTIEKIFAEKLIVIVRGISRHRLENVFAALLRGGVHLAEIPFDSSGQTDDTQTADAISEMREKFAGLISVGAGTVLTPKQAELACQAGAEYIISPSFDIETVHFCNRYGVVSIPGAMTPTEISAAYSAGADIVKLFPADFLGTSYIKAVRAPLSHIPMIAVGGINAENIIPFLESGVYGVGVGSSIADRKLAAAGRFDGITENALIYTEAVKSFKSRFEKP